MTMLPAFKLPQLFMMVLSLMICADTGCADDVLQSRLAVLLPHNARWALDSVELQTNRMVVTAGSAINERLSPGSLVKLFVAGAVLDHSARNGKLDLITRVSHDGTILNGTLDGNLYLVGRGNAFLLADDLERATQRLRQLGVARITGDIIADESLFDTKGLERNRQGSGYAQPGALGLDLHTVAVMVTPGELGKPLLVTLEPPLTGVRLAVDARTAGTAANSIKVVQLDDKSYRVTGNVAPSSGQYKWRFPLHSPALYAAEALRASLQRAEVTIEGAARTGKTPEAAKLIVGLGGPDLRKLLHDMNVNSLNLVADNLLLLLGAEKYGLPGTKEKGLRAVNDFLATLELPKEEVTIANGSGLGDENRVTSRFMTEFLSKVAKKSWFRNFYDSLPRPGMDGTLRGIAYSNQNFRVKSGRLENAFALAGYGVDEKGRRIAFTFMVNMPEKVVQNLEISGAEILRLLAETK
jgi:serine-type D-Ala-D-Ala carboxypeptidase/endopeptidase (penicillin-binding protein 4)